MVTDRQLRQCSDSDSDSSPTVGQRDVRQWSDSGPTVVRQLRHATTRAQVQTKNSSDLDMGRRPELKSDEFFVCTPIVIEIS